MCGSVIDGTKPARTSSRNDGAQRERLTQLACYGVIADSGGGACGESLMSQGLTTNNPKMSRTTPAMRRTRNVFRIRASLRSLGWLLLGRLFDRRSASGVVGRHRNVDLRLVSTRSILDRIVGRFVFHGNGTGGEEDCSALGVGTRGSESIPTYRFSRGRFPSSACRSHRTFSIDRSDRK